MSSLKGAFHGMSGKEARTVYQTHAGYKEKAQTGVEQTTGGNE